MKRLAETILSGGIVALTALGAGAQTVELSSEFNAQKPILPSSQYTPDEPYTAAVWVFNEGKRYDSALYNKILAAPAIDAEGHEWYEPEYTLTSGDGIDWQEATAPFSSDEYYKGQKSFRWVTSEIMGEMYMRRTFTLDGLTEGTVYLACGHDDAPSEWYINGVQVHTVADGWNNDEVLLLTADQKELLHTDGTPNLIAVHVHQNWGGAFADCGLYEADMFRKTTLLPTVGEGGAWPCFYYMLNYNDDMEVAVSAGWASLDEDESDWISGEGPFSIDDNMFFTTQWPSTVRPLLVRRHFTLTADELEAAKSPEASVTVSCSYDENPVMYLNGERIWGASGWNDNNYATINLSAEQRALLREGDNVLAVSLLSGNGGGHVDYGIKVMSPYEASGISVPSAGKKAEADSRIYNLYGQYVGTDTSRLARGIYIVGGRKMVIDNR